MCPLCIGTTALILSSSAGSTFALALGYWARKKHVFARLLSAIR